MSAILMFVSDFNQSERGQHDGAHDELVWERMERERMELEQHGREQHDGRVRDRQEHLHT